MPLFNYQDFISIMIGFVLDGFPRVRIIHRDNDFKLREKCHPT